MRLETLPRTPHWRLVKIPYIRTVGALLRSDSVCC